MRLLSFVLAAFIALTFESAANARTQEIGTVDKESLKAKCAAEGGTFEESADGEWFMCSKNCSGGECIVICFGDAGCLASTPGERVSTPADDRVIGGALNGTLLTQGPGGEREDERSSGLLGLLGLLGLGGLVGLFALARRDRRSDSPRSP